MLLRKCYICKKTLPVEGNFSYWKKRKAYNSSCNKCHNSRYFKTKKGKEAWNRASKKSYQKHKDKWMTRLKTRFYIKAGILKKQPCEVCGEIKVQAHHPDYNRPLLIIWLCLKHHRLLEKELKVETQNE